MDTDTQAVTVRNRQTGCYRRNKLTRKDNVMPKMKLNTPPFILVPQLRVDASSALCRDVIIIIITFMFLYQSTKLTYTFCGTFFRMPVFLLSSINVSHGCVTVDYVGLSAENSMCRYELRQMTPRVSVYHLFLYFCHSLVCFAFKS